MPGYRTWFLAVIGCSLIGLLSLGALRYSFAYPLAPVTAYEVPRYAVLDIAGTLAGMRRLTADIAWVQLLQYYGAPEEPLEKEQEFQLSWDMTKYLLGRPVEKEVCTAAGCSDQRHYHPHLDGGTYRDMARYCRRVTALDPFFSYAYLYGAGALAWNLDRPDEAAALISSGIAVLEQYRPALTRDVHQPFWQLHLYLSAIMYRKAGNAEKMLPLLEAAAGQPGAPNMIKAVLANIYQRDGRYAPALKLWFAIYDSRDPSYRVRAEEKIRELGRFAVP